MKQKELMLHFSPSCVLADKVVLVLPSEFGRLKGKDIAGCHVFILVGQGTLRVELNGKEQEMKGASLLDMMDWANICMLHASDDLCAYCLLPNRDFTNESLANLRPCPDSYLVNRFYRPVLSLSEREYKVLERQILLLASALGNPSHTYRHELSCVYFKSFMLELGEITIVRQKENNTGAMAMGKRDVIMMAFIRLVRQHFQREHNVDFYVRQLGVSSKHLSRIIKEVMGKTPHDVICYELIQHAITLLKADKLSIQGIASDLHFSDQSSFCKFFKKWTGMPPGEFRQR